MRRPFFLFFFCLGLVLPLCAVDKGAAERVELRPQILEQITAVLAYYRDHGDEDPLCQGILAERRRRLLMRLQEILPPYVSQGFIPLDHLTIKTTLRPLADGLPLRITRYATFSVPGSTTPDDRFDTPLRAPPIENGSGPSLRTRYDKADILNGALTDAIAAPLAWLSRLDFEQALLQGSVCLGFEDGSVQHYNVSVSNDRPYLPGQAARLQNRYWFFRATPQTLGYGLKPEWQLPIFPLTALAGDLDHHGLGAALLLGSGKNPTLAILADTGGAFVENPHQFDLFLGTVSDRKAYQELNASLPERMSVLLLE